MPEDLAYIVASGLYQYSLLDIIDIADIVDREPAEVADTYFALMDYLGTDGLLTAVSGLPRDDRWHSLARLAIRDDIYGSLRSLCFDVLAVGEPEERGEEKIEEWELTNGSRVQRARRTLNEIYESDERDLATLSVAARQIRSMTRTSGTGSFWVTAMSVSREERQKMSVCAKSRQHSFCSAGSRALVGHRHVPAHQPRHHGHHPRRGSNPVPA